MTTTTINIINNGTIARITTDCYPHFSTGNDNGINAATMGENAQVYKLTENISSQVTFAECVEDLKKYKEYKSLSDAKLREMDAKIEEMIQKEKDSGKLHNIINKDERKAIYLYTYSHEENKPHVYTDLNALMRKDDDLTDAEFQPFKKFFKLLCTALKKLPEYKENGGSVVRGIVPWQEDEDDQETQFEAWKNTYKKKDGNYLIWNSFTSTSKKGEAVEKWLSEKNYRVVFSINSSHGGRYITPYSALQGPNQSEDEILFLPGCVFKIANVVYVARSTHCLVNLIQEGRPSHDHNNNNNVNVNINFNAKDEETINKEITMKNKPIVLAALKKQYSSHSQVYALFGDPMALEGQYINVQMVYQVLEEKAKEQNSSQKEEEDQKRQANPYVVTSYETIYGRKEPLPVEKIFSPAKDLLKENQMIKEENPNEPPTFVLLQGSAGIGKTTFVNYVSREWALGRMWGQFSWVFALRFRDLLGNDFIQLTKEGKTLGLSEWVFHGMHFNSSTDMNAFKLFWKYVIEEEIKEKKVLFVLDGYDEAPTSHPCEDAFLEILTCNDITKITTSRPHGVSNLPREVNRRELEVVGFVDENVDKYVEYYFKAQKQIDKIAPIKKCLRKYPAVWGIAHIPVTLNILCGVLQQENNVEDRLAGVHTLSSLYEAMEVCMLQRAYLAIPNKKKEHEKQLSLLSKDKKSMLLKQQYSIQRRHLSRLAYKTFAKQKLILSLDESNDILLENNVGLNELSNTINELLALGLFRPAMDEKSGGVERSFEFLHLTFQEHYASQYLLELVERRDPKISEEMERVKLDPRYQIVIWFVAGAVKMKESFDFLMKAIAPETGNDLIGNVELALMVRCTEENWELAKESGWVGKTMKRLQEEFYLYFQIYKADPWNINLPVWVATLKQGPRYYAQQVGEADLFNVIFSKAGEDIEIIEKIAVMFKVASPMILKMIGKRLSDSNSDVHRNAAVAVGRLGSSAATPEILSQLAKLLGDSDWFVSNSAANAVGELGSSAATPEILSQLVKLLSDSDSGVRSSAVKTVGKLGSSAATPEILSQLAKLHGDNDWKVRRSASDAVGRLGSSAATPEIILQLAKLLSDSNPSVSKSASDAFGKLGSSTATPAFLSQIAKLHEDDDWKVRRSAADAVGALGSSAATPEILSQLAKLLGDSYSDVRRCAAYAVKSLGSSAATPEILSQLAKLLGDGYPGVRSSAASALRALRSSPATLDILSQLAELVRDINSGVRGSAANAVGALRSSAATPEILSQLAKLLRDSDSDVRWSAANDVRALGSSAATPEFLSQLAKLLGDGYPGVRMSATDAVGALGSSAATPEILSQLAKLLCDSNSGMRSRAADAVGALGPSAATPEILSQLAKLLGDSDSGVRSSAVEVFGKLGSSAATPEILSQLAKLLGDSDSGVRRSAADAVRALGSYAATPEILSALEKPLGDSDSGVRRGAANAVRELGSYAATPEILSQLAKLLGDSNSGVRSSAASAVGALRSVTNPIILKGFLHNITKMHDFPIQNIISLLMQSPLTLSNSPHFVTFATAITVASFIVRNVSLWIDKNNNLCGFVDKTYFAHPLTAKQSQWFVHWVPKIIQSLSQDTIKATLQEIENSAAEYTSTNK